MRFRLGLMLGFSAGYYLGAMAGRERYEQINRTISKIKRSDVYETATEKAHEVVEAGVTKAKEAVDSTMSNGDDPTPPTMAPSDPFLRPSPPLP